LGNGEERGGESDNQGEERKKNLFIFLWRCVGVEEKGREKKRETYKRGKGEATLKHNLLMQCIVEKGGKKGGY